MVLVGQGMEPEEAPVKVQVVYYLSRAGQLQQPHLIDVTVSPHSNGLYLRDVKSKLTAIRGKGVADSFSWSCKSQEQGRALTTGKHGRRNYKETYIWQDLGDDDKILPLCDGEFVLKGSGLYAGYRASGRLNYLDCQNDPESTSLSPKKDSAKVHTKMDSKKFDFEAVKRSLDVQVDQMQDQNELAAALSLSLQLMSNPNAHLRRFSKDKSMDLNQQVMNSLSQAKAGPAEECTLDHYDMSSNETFLSEESTTRFNNFRENSTTRERSKSTSSSSRRTDMIYDAAVDVAKEVESKHQPISRSGDCGSTVGKDGAKTRQEKPEELPSIKTAKIKASVANEGGDNMAFMLSPRRIMAVLSTPEKRLGKMLHSTSIRSSILSNSTSTHSVEPLSAIKLSKQATCLSQLRFCSQLSHHATDSRPDSPVRQNCISVLVPSSTESEAPAVRNHDRGPYWARWKAGRKSRSTSETLAKVVPEKPSSPTPTLLEAKTTAVHRVQKTSFEFDSPADTTSSGPGTPSLHTRTSSTESSNPPLLSGKSIKSSASGTIILISADTPYGPRLSSSVNSNAELMSPVISVKEVITEHLPVQQSTPANGQSFSGVISAKETLTPMNSSGDHGSQDFGIDTANLPRVSISDSISAAKVPDSVTAVRPESPESPLKPNPPCSPVRTNSPAARTLSSPSSFHRRSEDGRARARGLLKEVAPKDSRFLKDLAKDLDRSKASSGKMRSITSSKRISGIKNGTTSIGAKSISSTFNRSPPRISSLLWEDPPPHTPKKITSTIDRDERPLTAGRSNLDWEKSLQDAASASLPPPDFGQILQECGQCGRTFKPDSLKVHMRGCHSLRRSRDFTLSAARPLTF